MIEYALSATATFALEPGTDNTRGPVAARFLIVDQTASDSDIIIKYIYLSITA